MPERYTRTDAEAAFKRLAHILGKPTGAIWHRKADHSLEAVIGTWFLDSNPTYGGYRVAEMMEHGGEKSPLGHMRRNAREFCEAVQFAFDVLAEYQRTRKDIPEARGYPASVSETGQ